MPMRVQEIHPAIAHYPVALVPAAVMADILGTMMDDDGMVEIGRRLFPVAVASMALTGMAGFMAQGAVKTDEHTEKILITHRTLNVSGLIMAMALAYMRGQQRRPSAAYMAGGLALTALLTYSGYLGGRMVYEHGVGVRTADGIQRGRAPQFPGSGIGRMTRQMAVDAGSAMGGAARDAVRGRFVPVFQEKSANRSRPARKPASRSAKRSSRRTARAA